MGRRLKWQWKRGKHREVVKDKLDHLEDGMGEENPSAVRGARMIQNSDKEASATLCTEGSPTVIIPLIPGIFSSLPKELHHNLLRIIFLTPREEAVVIIINIH